MGIGCERRSVAVGVASGLRSVRGTARTYHDATLNHPKNPDQQHDQLKLRGIAAGWGRFRILRQELENLARVQDVRSAVYPGVGCAGDAEVPPPGSTADWASKHREHDQVPAAGSRRANFAAASLGEQMREAIIGFPLYRSTALSGRGPQRPARSASPRPGAPPGKSADARMPAGTAAKASRAL